MHEEPQARIHEWLLTGDPSIRWQTMRDLLDEAPPVVAIERARVAQEGWGQQLLAKRGQDGRWGGGLYSPKWTSTLYTLLLLRRLGLDPANDEAQQGAQLLVDQGEWVDDAIIFWKSTKTIDLCVVGLALSVFSYFEIRDERIDNMVTGLKRRQLDDGSWDDIRDVANKEFHTTIALLEGLKDYARQVPEGPDVEAMLVAGREFLLTRRLFGSEASTDPIDPAFTRFSFPPRWHYDVLRALDHFGAAHAPFDTRLNEALDIVEKRQRPDGTWLLQNPHPGRTWFELESSRQPSRLNTLRALRVLRAYQSDRSS